MSEIKNIIARDGFVNLNQIFEPDLIEKFVNEAYDMKDWPDAKGKYWRYYENDDNSKLNRMERFYEYSQYCSQIINHPKLISLLSEIMDDTPVLFKEKINFKTSGGSGFAYHQDQAAGWSRYAPIFWSVAIAIDECNEDNGQLEIAKHIEQSRDNLSDWAPLGEEILRELEFQPVPMKPGDVAIFDSYVPHGSKPNYSNKPRKVMYLTYNQSRYGDLRAQYYEDKSLTYPQDCERLSGVKYIYKV